MRCCEEELSGSCLDTGRMSYSTSASSQLAAKSLRRSSRKANANHVFGGVAVAGLVLGCAWTVYANIFAASIYPTLAGGNFDAPVTRHKQSVAAQTPQAIVNNVFAALPEPAPVVAAPATIASTSTLRFDDRFAAAAPQGVAPRPQAETMQLASASPSVEVTKPVDAPKLLEAVKPNKLHQRPRRSRPSRRHPRKPSLPRARVLPSRTWRSAPRRR